MPLCSKFLGLPHNAMQNKYKVTMHTCKSQYIVGCGKIVTEKSRKRKNKYTFLWIIKKVAFF